MSERTLSSLSSLCWWERCDHRHDHAAFVLGDWCLSCFIFENSELRCVNLHSLCLKEVQFGGDHEPAAETRSIVIPDDFCNKHICIENNDGLMGKSGKFVVAQKVGARRRETVICHFNKQMNRRLLPPVIRLRYTAASSRAEMMRKWAEIKSSHSDMFHEIPLHSRILKLTPCWTLFEQPTWFSSRWNTFQSHIWTLLGSRKTLPAKWVIGLKKKWPETCGVRRWVRAEDPKQEKARWQRLALFLKSKLLTFPFTCSCPASLWMQDIAPKESGDPRLQKRRIKAFPTQMI